MRYLQSPLRFGFTKIEQRLIWDAAWHGLKLRHKLRWFHRRGTVTVRGFWAIRAANATSTDSQVHATTSRSKLLASIWASAEYFALPGSPP